jgi:hypothetical protein
MVKEHKIMNLIEIIIINLKIKIKDLFILSLFKEENNIKIHFIELNQKFKDQEN